MKPDSTPAIDTELKYRDKEAGSPPMNLGPNTKVMKMSTPEGNNANDREEHTTDTSPQVSANMNTPEVEINSLRGPPETEESNKSSRAQNDPPRSLLSSKS